MEEKKLPKDIPELPILVQLVAIPFTLPPPTPNKPRCYTIPEVSEEMIREIFPMLSLFVTNYAKDCPPHSFSLQTNEKEDQDNQEKNEEEEEESIELMVNRAFDHTNHLFSQQLNHVSNLPLHLISFYDKLRSKVTNSAIMSEITHDLLMRTLLGGDIKQFRPLLSLLFFYVLPNQQTYQAKLQPIIFPPSHTSFWSLLAEMIPNYKSFHEVGATEIEDVQHCLELFFVCWMKVVHINPTSEAGLSFLQTCLSLLRLGSDENWVLNHLIPYCIDHSSHVIKLGEESNQFIQQREEAEERGEEIEWSEKELKRKLVADTVSDLFTQLVDIKPLLGMVLEQCVEEEEEEELEENGDDEDENQDNEEEQEQEELEQEPSNENENETNHDQNQRDNDGYYDVHGDELDEEEDQEFGAFAKKRQQQLLLDENNDEEKQEDVIIESKNDDDDDRMVEES